MCSATSIFPISSFPNINAFYQENSMGVKVLKSRDFMKCGAIITIFSFIIIVTIGYGLMVLWKL
jgi:phosphate transporter